MPDIPHIRDNGWDYDLDDVVHATTTEHFKALGDPTRRTIIDLVTERAASTTELAAALGRPKGTVDHHLKVLERAGFVRVVRTRQVRAMTERFWGRTARTIVFGQPAGPMTEGAHPDHFLATALAESDRIAEGDISQMTSGLRHARIPADRAADFARRLDALAVEFVDGPRGGDTVFGFVYAVYPTDLPVLPAPTSRS